MCLFIDFFSPNPPHLCMYFIARSIYIRPQVLVVRNHKGGESFHTLCAGPFSTVKQLYCCKYLMQIGPKTSGHHVKPFPEKERNKNKPWIYKVLKRQTANVIARRDLPPSLGPLTFSSPHLTPVKWNGMQLQVRCVCVCMYGGGIGGRGFCDEVSAGISN